jgi:predicted patatin/cPLA2 family phospholipase
MFKLFTDSTIDMVQASKKVAIDTFVKHEALAKTLTNFVDTQTEYTKKVVDNTLNTGYDLYQSFIDKGPFTELTKPSKKSSSTEGK